MRFFLLQFFSSFLLNKYSLTYFIYTLFIFYFSHLSAIFLVVTTVITIMFFSFPICYVSESLLYITYLWSFYLSVSFTLFLLKHGNSFRNSSSDIIFAGLFFSLLLNRSLGCCGTVFTYCISGSCFIVFLCFKRSRGCSGTF